VIRHLTGRLIGKRDPIDVDADAVLRACAAAGTAVEIDGALDRLDPPAELLRRAGELGVIFVVAGRAAEADRRRHAALLAQRGWVDRSRVVDTWTPDAIDAWLAGR